MKNIYENQINDFNKKNYSKDKTRTNVELKVATGATVTGIGVPLGVTSAVGAFGTASTGTAISTLSGAAASNATLAAIGGGSIATGGGGMILGTVILTGGSVLIALGVGYGLWKLLTSSSRNRTKYFDYNSKHIYTTPYLPVYKNIKESN